LEKSRAKQEGVEKVSVNLALETLDIHVANPKLLGHVNSWVDQAGFGTETEQAQLVVDNITCAACTARIEKSLNRVPGVTQVSANLATSQLQVEWVAGVTSLPEIKERLATINYPVIESSQAEQKSDDSQQELFRHSMIGIALSLPMVVTMVLGMAGLDLMLPGWAQLLLTTPVQFWLGLRFYRGAYHALKNGSANMDVLVALGTSAAYFYSLYLWLSAGSMHLYFESAAVVISLVLLGKWMEARAKNVAGDAIRKLMNLQPPTAQRWQGDQLVEVDVTSLNVGDEIQIQPGSTVPVDGVVVSGSTSVNEAMLTGESIPVAKKNGRRCARGYAKPRWQRSRTRV
jgi:Cu+-exporting ATPase